MHVTIRVNAPVFFGEALAAAQAYGDRIVSSERRLSIGLHVDERMFPRLRALLQHCATVVEDQPIFEIDADTRS